MNYVVELHPEQPFIAFGFPRGSFIQAGFTLAKLSKSVSFSARLTKKFPPRLLASLHTTPLLAEFTAVPVRTSRVVCHFLSKGCLEVNTVVAAKIGYSNYDVCKF